MKDTNINVGLNNSDCLKEQNYFTHITYQNVCNGTHYDVPYGSLDYVGLGLLVLIGLFIGGFIIKIILD